MPFTRFLDGRPPHTTPHKTTHTTIKIRSGSTHTGELDAAVTALGSGTLLLQVKVPEHTTRGLDDANLVGPRVVPVKRENSSICRSKTIQSCISSILIVANIDSSEEEALCEMREFFLANVRVPAALEDGNHSQYFRSRPFLRRQGNSRIAVCCSAFWRA